MAIECPLCSFANPDSNLFCGQCGKQLPRLDQPTIRPIAPPEPQDTPAVPDTHDNEPSAEPHRSEKKPDAPQLEGSWNTPLSKEERRAWKASLDSSYFTRKFPPAWWFFWFGIGCLAFIAIVQTEKAQVWNGHEAMLCRALISFEFSQPIANISAKAPDANGEVYLSYTRKDGKFWDYRCKRDRDHMVWKAPGGRWRDAYPADPEMVLEDTGMPKQFRLIRRFDGEDSDSRVFKDFQF